MKSQPIAAPSGIPFRVSWVSPSAQTAEEEVQFVARTRSKKKKKQVAAEQLAFSIPQFCVRNHISWPTYRRLRLENRNPREMRIGLNLIRIAAEDERDWQQRMKEGGEEFALKATERAVKAGTAAAKSEKHISRKGKRGWRYPC
jgi:hypothetical protein